MARADVQAGKAYVTLYVRNSLLVKGLKDVRAQIKSLADQFTQLGSTMLRFGIAAGIPAGLSLKTYADFDDAMRAVRGVTQASADDFQKLTDKAKALGASTSFTATQVANLMIELGRAGFSPDQVNEMTGAVLNLSRATGTDATLSAGIMAATIRQFALQATEATRVSDALTVAANKSFNSVESLGESLNYAGPVAADFNMSLEDTLAILGALGNVGIQGSEAGTALRRLLVISGAEAKNLQKIFGVSFLDAAGNARPLVDALGDVFAATKNLSTSQRSSKFNEAFGLLGITSASAISKNVADVKALREELGRAEGTAAKTAAEMDAGFGGSLRIMLSAVEAVAIAVGESLAGPLKKAADAATPFIQLAAEWVKQNTGIVNTIGAVIAGTIAVGGTLIAVGGALNVILFAMSGLGALVGVVSLVFSPFVLATAAVIGLLTQLQAVGPFTTYVAQSFGSVGDYISRVWQDMSAEFSAAWGAITAAIGAGNIQDAMDVAAAYISLKWAEIVAKFNAVWIGAKWYFVQIWEEATNSIAKIFINLWAGIQKGAAIAVSGMKAFFTAMSANMQAEFAYATGAMTKQERDFVRDLAPAAMKMQIRQELDGKGGLADIEQQRKDALAALEQDKSRNDQQNNAESDAALQADRDRLTFARNKLTALQGRAEDNALAARERTRANAPVAPQLPELPNAQQLANTYIAPTFSANAAFGLGPSKASPVEAAVKEATKATRQQLRLIERQTAAVEKLERHLALQFTA